MDNANTILITVAILTVYGAVRAVTDIISIIAAAARAIANLFRKVIPKRAQTVKKQETIIDLPYRAIISKPAVKIDRRNKYTVNVEACEAYLASRKK